MKWKVSSKKSNGQFQTGNSARSSCCAARRILKVIFKTKPPKKAFPQRLVFTRATSTSRHRQFLLHRRPQIGYDHSLAKHFTARDRLTLRLTHRRYVSRVIGVPDQALQKKWLSSCSKLGGERRWWAFLPLSFVTEIVHFVWIFRRRNGKLWQNYAERHVFRLKKMISKVVKHLLQMLYSFFSRFEPFIYWNP